MENYKIRVKKSVAKDLRSIPNKDVAKILACIEVLAENPGQKGVLSCQGKNAIAFDRAFIVSFMRFKIWNWWC